MVHCRVPQKVLGYGAGEVKLKTPPSGENMER